ncbi:MAG: transposase [Candidatus Nitrosopolaris sp.]
MIVLHTSYRPSSCTYEVYTNEYLAYENLKKYGFVHKQVCHSQKEYARGDVHVNNCEESVRKKMFERILIDS